MEGLAPSLVVCLQMRMTIESGESVFNGVRKSLCEVSGLLRQDLLSLLIMHEKGESFSAQKMKCCNLYRLALLELIYLGLRGQSILARLKEMESELIRAAEFELEDHLALMPLKSLFFLMLIQFPAFLLLLLGPLLNELIQEING